MGKASVDIAEILLLPVKDFQVLFTVIFLNLFLIYKLVFSVVSNSKKQFLENHGEDYNLVGILFHHVKYILTSLVDLNKRVLYSIFFELSREQPLIPLFFIVGFISWMWLAIKMHSVLMGVIGLIPIFMIFTGPMGIWYLIFGIPQWVSNA
jgi:hypothetical protein